jgi:hypothetical protein
MKTVRPSPTLAEWVTATWPLLIRGLNPVKIPRPREAAADSQWEGEGGAIKPPRTRLNSQAINSDA